MVFVFGGVEAIGLAAVGYFFGKEVHRERADKAEEAVKEAGEKKGATEQRLSDLVEFIETKRSARAYSPPLLAEISALAKQGDARTKMPELMAFLDEKQSGVRPAPAHDDWDELASFARSLARPQ